MRINELRHWIYEQLELKPLEWNEKTVVWTDGYYYVAVNNLKDPSFITVWTEDNKKVGSLTADSMLKNKERWKKVRDVAVDKRHQGNRLSLRMYQVLLQTMPKEYAGLEGYEPDIVSRRVIQNYKRLGGENINDYWFVKNPNRTLHEEWFTSIKTNWSKEPVEVFKNPSRKELAALTDQGHGAARGFLIGRDLIAWTEAVHFRMARELGIQNNKELIPLVIYTDGTEANVMVTDYSGHTVWKHNPGVAHAIVNHPYMDSMFSFIEVSYFDEAIVGDWEEMQHAT